MSDLQKQTGKVPVSAEKSVETISGGIGINSTNMNLHAVDMPSSSSSLPEDAKKCPSMIHSDNNNPDCSSAGSVTNNIIKTDASNTEKLDDNIIKTDAGANSSVGNAENNINKKPHDVNIKTGETATTRGSSIDDAASFTASTSSARSSSGVSSSTFPSPSSSSRITAQRERRRCSTCYVDVDVGGGRGDDAFREHLLQHLVDFEGKSLCPVCESQCETNKGMQTHFMMVHGQVSRLVCPDRNCVQTFWTRSDLENHKQSH